MVGTVVTKKQLSISIIFNGGNTIIFLFYLYKLFIDINQLKYLTKLSFYANSIYLLICLYCDIKIYYHNKNSNIDIEALHYSLMLETTTPGNENNYDIFAEKLNDWNRNKFGVICNTFSYFITIIFWILFSMGSNYMKIGIGFWAAFDSIYLHLIITIIVIIDVFSTHRKKLVFSWSYYGIIAGLFICYSIYSYVDKRINLKTNTYMNRSVFFLAFLVLLSLILLLFCYLNHIYLIRYKY